jgi:riboflavin synthase
MFTGIITDLGKILKITDNQTKDLIIDIELLKITNNRNFDIGCSISCNGICLTLIKKQSNILSFQVSQETKNKTTITNWKIGDLINIEFALRVGDELGGHMVLGHIDCVTKIDDIKPNQESWIFSINTPKEINKHISKKGSVTINGTSLTINNISNNQFDVNIIPHTYKNTNFHKLQKDDLVNIEIDMISRYLEKLITK